MNNWQYHDKKTLELKKYYNKISKQTQNRLQEIINSFNIEYEHLYNIADNKAKNKINIYIEEWQDKGLLIGYFGMIAKKIYKRTKVKNSEILELLIYGVYIEEQRKLEQEELNTFKKTANYYYQEGQQEVNNTLPKNERKQISVIPNAIFLALLDMANSQGYVWEQYVEAVVKYNAEQLYRQIIIDLQQNKDIDIQDGIYQNIIKKQQNTKLCINEHKISGAVDNQLIGINNLAKLEGIKSIDNNAQIRFIATIDGNETDMCHSLDNQLFYIDKENVFDRYYGETQKDLSIQRIKCLGLVLGLNLPPISHHYHYCRSSITYQVPQKQENTDKKFNIFSSKVEKEIERKYNVNKARIKGIDVKALNNILDNMNEVYKDFPQIKEKIKEIQSIEHPNGGLNIEPDLKDNNFIIQINKKFFKNEKIVQQQYKKDVKIGFHPKGTTYKDMGIHELGHSITFEIIKSKYKDKNQIANDWNKNITAKEIVSNAFKNLQINDKLTQDILRNNISNYSISSYGETIGEAFADYYANKEHSYILSKEIVKIMKGMI